MQPMKIKNKVYKRVTAISHLQMAVWHAEQALAADSDSWEYVDVADCRDGRDTFSNLLAAFKTDE